MMKKLLSLVSFLGTVTLLGYLTMVVWDFLGPNQPLIGADRKDVADMLVSEVVEDLRQSKGSIRQVALLHLQNDPTDYVSTKLRTTIEQRGILDLYDRTVGEKMLMMLHMRQPTCAELSEAIAFGREAGVEGVIFGVVRALEAYPGGVKAEVEVSIAEVATGRAVFTKRYSRDSTASAGTPPISPVIAGSPRNEASPQTRSDSSATVAEESFPWISRLLVWAIGVLLLPMFTISFIRTSVAKRSNRVNGFVLGVYSLIGALLGWMLLGAAVGTWGTIIFFTVCVLGVSMYNMRIMNYALKLEET